jgi:hypothetical protein
MPKSKKPKWEYLVVYMQDSSVAQDQKDVDIYLDADRFRKQLNKHGEAGWELVSFQWREQGRRRRSSAEQIK